MADADAPAPEECLEPTWFLDRDDPAVVAFAEGVVADAGATDDRERAVALFVAVRDGWRYDPYNTSNEPESFRASAVLASSSNWCVPKSVLLSAAARAVGIPARLGFADVRNHLQSEKLRERMGTDLFAYHGYSELWIDGDWRKASSAFNKELCEKFGTKVLEFDGVARRPDASVRRGRQPPHGVRAPAGLVRRPAPRRDPRRLRGDLRQEPGRDGRRERTRRRLRVTAHGQATRAAGTRSQWSTSWE